MSARSARHLDSTGDFYRARTRQLERLLKQRCAEAAQMSARLRMLTADLILAEQHERRRLAQILHDGLQQVLIAAKLRLALMSGEAVHDVDRVIRDISALMDNALDISRTVTAGLNPPILQEFGLLPALEWLVRWVREKHRIALNLKTGPVGEEPEEPVSILLFQATRALVAYAAGHAGVETVHVRVAWRQDRIQITLREEHRGFDWDEACAAKSAEGPALQTIRGRLDVIGGSIALDNTRGKMTRIFMNAPLRLRAGESGLESNRLRERTGSGNRVRLLLVDDHSLVREGLKRLLSEVPDFEIAGEAPDGETGIRLARSIRPDVILMDVCMPGMGGIQATKILRAEQPDIPIIGLSMFSEKEQSDAMCRAGAAAYVVKTGRIEAVITAIRNCLQPRPPLS